MPPLVVAEGEVGEAAVTLVVHTAIVLMLTAPDWAATGLFAVQQYTGIADALGVSTGTIRGFGLGLLAVATAFGVLFEAIVGYVVLLEAVPIWQGVGVFVGYLSYMTAGVIFANTVGTAVD